MKKVAIVGVEGSGKTVMLTGLGDLYSHPDANGYFLDPKNFTTAAYVAEKVERMRKGEWPSATAGDELEGLDWTLKRGVSGERRRPETVCEVSFLDFAGEVYRTAFGIGEGDPSLVKQADELKRYVREADDLLVLINLRDVIVHGMRDRRVQEATWITKAILDTALTEEVGHKVPRAAIVLSQADSYAETIASCGGALGVLKKFLTHVANNYGWLDIFTVSAVDKTKQDADGRLVPAEDFTAKGLLPIMEWICRGVGPAAASGDGASAEGMGLPRPLVSAHAPGDVKKVVLPGGMEMRFRWCPPGTFTMGSPAGKQWHESDEKLHRVTLTRGFWMGETPVTQAQWQSVMETNPSGHKESFLGSLFNPQEPGKFLRYPVDGVSWEDCRQFIFKVNRALSLHFWFPTEAEWEYACRAGTSGPYGGTGKLHEMGWFSDNSGQRTHPVGLKNPNAWGLYDMHGNVWEWCSDWFAEYPSGAVTDPKGPPSGMNHVQRGGSWGTYAKFCRSAFRNHCDPLSRYDYFGLRLCCPAGPND